MSEFLFGTGTKRSLSGPAQTISRTVAAVIGIIVLLSVFLYPEEVLYQAICFGLFFFEFFINYTTPGSNTEEQVPIYDYVLGGLSLLVSVYIAANIDRIVMRQDYISAVTTMDMAFGILTVVLIIEGTRRVLGPWLPAISILSVLYMIYGNHITGRLGHQGFSFEHIIEGLFLSDYGIWGSTFGIAVGQVMVFMIFATLFQRSGAADFLFDFAASIAGKTRGGVAKIAVITSALFGMITGGPVTDVTTTGSMTIPAMIKKGFSPVSAAAIESCASVGATFMPPIMGSMAFVMAEVAGISYGEVAKRAFLPAILYFAVIFFIVDFRSRRLNIEGFADSERKRLLTVAKRGLAFFLPLLYLTIRLISGIYPERAAVESIAVVLIISFLQKKNLFDPKIILQVLVTAVQRGRMVVATMAACSIFVGSVMITGLPSKLSSFLSASSEYSSLLVLVIAMVVCMFLGLAMNGTSSYLITAVICAPILIQQGYNVLGVHMFILFFAAMATLTPPVALTTYTAASIANAPPLPVSTEAMKMGLVAYILPFAFVYNPTILQYGSFWACLTTFISALVGVAMIASAIEKWWFGIDVNLLLRCIILMAGCALIIAKPAFIAGSLTLLLLICLYTIFYKKIHKAGLGS